VACAYTERVEPTPAPPPAAPLGARALAERLRPALDARPARDITTPGRRAAVLLVLYDRADAAHLLLTRRADHLPSHPGQVSLPGGVRDPGDRSLEHTALRETHEEVGIAPASLAIIGRLDEVDTIASGFLIRPYVALAEAPIAPVPSDEEVARLLEVPVHEILAADAALPPRPGIRTMRYPLAGEDVWGATARILRGFCAVARHALGAGGP